MDAVQFVEKWSGVQLSERAASHEHFIDLCRLLGQSTPAEADPTGENYCFEKAVKVVNVASKGSKGEGGFVDVWKRGCFGWSVSGRTNCEAAMNLFMDGSLASPYKSRSQMARVVTENWASTNLYCVACEVNSLACTPRNTKAHDFLCIHCGAFYQLKSQQTRIGLRVVDAGYSAMLASIAAGNTPNLLVLQYSLAWEVVNLLLVPSFFFAPSAIEKRKPLASTARRAGWVGCNILLSRISLDGRIDIISQGVERERDFVRQNYARVKPLAVLNPRVRGWTLDVLNAVRRIGRSRFTIDDAYSFAPSLSRLHPDNQHVRPKIRQQLQVLRDMGLLRFVRRGLYEFTNQETAYDARIRQNHSRQED